MLHIVLELVSDVLYLLDPDLPRSGAPVTAPKAAGGKRPAWDLKGKMEDMEKRFELTNERLEALETEKNELQGKVEVKDEVVLKSSAEIRELERTIGRSEELIGSLTASLEDRAEKHGQEKVRLKRALEEEEVHKRRLERNLATLQDELACKQIEVRRRLSGHDRLPLLGVRPQDECGGPEQQPGGRAGGAGRDRPPARGH